MGKTRTGASLMATYLNRSQTDVVIVVTVVVNIKIAMKKNNLHNTTTCTV